MRLGFIDVPTLLAAATFASSVHAGSFDIHTEQIDPGSVLPNHVVNHVLVDFTEAALRGQQMVMKLTQGSIYQYAGPNDIYLTDPLWYPPINPDHPVQQYDSWVGIGPPNMGGLSQGVLAVGCAANIPGGCDSPRVPLLTCSAVLFKSYPCCRHQR